MSAEHAFDMVGDKKRLSVAAVLDAASEKWGERNFIHSAGVAGFKSGVRIRTFSQLAFDAKALAAALIERGLLGQNILLLGENSYEWMVADLAIMGYVGVCVAVNRDWPSSDLVRAARFTDCKAALCSRGCRDAIVELEAEMPVFVLEDDLSHLIDEGKELLGSRPGAKSGNEGTGASEELSSARPSGEGVNLPGARPDVEPFSLRSRDPKQAAKIIFSSGTTGIPKAAVLSQENIFFGADNLQRRAPMGENDRCYLLIPLYHTYGGIFNFIYPLLFGMEIYLSSGNKQLPEEMQQVKPTIFSGVPRIFELILARAREAAASASAASANGADGGSVGVQTAGNASSPHALHIILNNIFGGEMRYMFCGGSPMALDMQLAYMDAGLCVLNAYALTETASSFSIEYPADMGSGSVGTIFEDLELRIDAADADGWGEVLVRGGNTFLGYYGNPEATELALTEDGYFRSGDIGRMDGQRRLYLKGRCRPMFKTTTGERVYADDVVAKITDERIVAAKVYCLHGQVAAQLYTDLSLEECEALVDDVNTKLPRYAKIAQYEVFPAKDHYAWK